MSIRELGKVKIGSKMAARWIAITDAWVAEHPDLANRNLSEKHVAELAAEMSSGAWRCTNQGLLLGHGEIIIDGAHRMRAIVKSGVTCEMYVFQDESLVSARDVPVDVLAKGRAGWWVRRKDRKLWECAQIMGQLIHGRPSGVGNYQAPCTHAELCAIVDSLAAITPALSSTARKILSAASVRCGVYLAMSEHADRAEEISEQYRKLVCSDANERWPIVTAFSDQLLTAAASKRPLPRGEALIRSYHAFSAHPSKRRAGKIQIKHPDSMYERLFAVSRSLVQGSAELV